MKTLTKEQALKLVGDLARASARNALVHNSMARGSCSVAIEKERKAAVRLMAVLVDPIFESPTREELETALGW